MPAAPHPHRTVLPRLLAALLSLAAVLVLSAGAEGGPGTEVRTGALSSGMPGPPGEAEGVPDASTETELRLPPGPARRSSACPPHAKTPPTGRPDRTRPAVPARTAPARGPAPHAARSAVLRC
ncbi:hypothetical protein [Streptomyces sp. NPDC058657]|uniref:hypothetical protein n=1 Tax=unclassified Streptomyces TaxID=2593676 RepID=UPI003652961C